MTYALKDTVRSFLQYFSILLDDPLSLAAAARSGTDPKQETMDLFSLSLVSSFLHSS